MDNKISCSAIIYGGARIERSIIGDNCTVGNDCDLVNVEMNDRTEFGRRCVVRNTKIGFGSYAGTNTIIKNSTIGKFCSIGWNVSIGGGNHNYNNVSMYTDYWYKKTFGISVQSNETNEIAEPVFVGNDVWIGAGVNILNGIKIGDGAVVGSGSVVTKDVAPYTIVAGVPAKEIKKRFSKDIIELLLKIEWWNWDYDTIIQGIDFLRNCPKKQDLERILLEYKNR